jgi:hypothetical protein
MKVGFTSSCSIIITFQKVGSSLYFFLLLLLFFGWSNWNLVDFKVSGPISFF